MADEKFNGPLVGTGPYTLAEWQTGQFARFVRNPNYWGPKGFEDEVVCASSPTTSTACSRRSRTASWTTRTT